MYNGVWFIPSVDIEYRSHWTRYIYIYTGNQFDKKLVKEKLLKNVDVEYCRS